MIGSAVALAVWLSAAGTGTMCVVDMGSNSFKVIVGEVSGGTYIQDYVEKRTLGVGDDMSKTAWS